MNETFALDTNVIVAAVSALHAHHEPALSVLQAIRKRGDDLVIPAPALVESYSVLTRLPRPHRLAPAMAAMLLSTNFQHGARVVALEGEMMWTFMSALPERAVRGGLSYDAHVAECALKGRTTVLLTFNTRHFERFESTSMTIKDPRAMG